MSFFSYNLMKTDGFSWKRLTIFIHRFGAYDSKNVINNKISYTNVWKKITIKLTKYIQIFIPIKG